MAKKKVYTSAPGAVRGKAPITTNTVQSKPKPKPKSSNNLSKEQKTGIQGLTDLTKSLGDLAGLVGKMGTGGTGGASGYRSDAEYAGTDISGTSSTGKHYVNGKEVNSQEWNAFLNEGSGGGTGGVGATNLDPYKAQQQADRQSAYDLLMAEFTKYGLGSLVEPLKGFIINGASPAELTLRLQETDAYKKRFAANADRIAKGLAALNPAEYIAMEDQYQNIMRNYGLPSSYYSKDAIGTQAGFQQLLANDVSATELEDRVLTAQQRVNNANPEVTKALKAFYPDITNGDILAYALDPTKALDMIKRKVTAAEIGGAALAQGLSTSAQSAEDLARYGVNKQQAEQGYQTIGQFLPRASQLADIYNQDAYTQAVAEAEVFGTGGAVNAAERRKKLSTLEQAKFSGSSGASGNALSRDRASSQMQYRESGAGAF